MAVFRFLWNVFYTLFIWAYLVILFTIKVALIVSVALYLLIFLQFSVDYIKEKFQ